MTRVNNEAMTAAAKAMFEGEQLDRVGRLLPKFERAVEAAVAFELELADLRIASITQERDRLASAVLEAFAGKVATPVEGYALAWWHIAASVNAMERQRREVEEPYSLPPADQPRQQSSSLRGSAVR